MNFAANKSTNLQQIPVEKSCQISIEISSAFLKNIKTFAFCDFKPILILTKQVSNILRYYENSKNPFKHQI